MRGSCTVSGLSTTSIPVQVIIIQATYATVPFSESLEATWMTTWETGLTTVKSVASHTPVYGLNSFILDTPFTWNGTSILVIEMNYNNNIFNPPVNNTAKHSPTSFVSTIFYRANNLSAPLFIIILYLQLLLSVVEMMLLLFILMLHQ